MSKHGASSEDFGKDLGLVHEAVVTGRKVGADRGFWKALVHEPQLMRTVAAVVKNKGRNLVTTQERAAKIMGKKNFFHPEDDQISHRLLPAELELLRLIPFPEHILEEMRSTHILISAIDIAFAELREHHSLQHAFRVEYTTGFYNRKRDPWAYKSPDIGWHLIQKTVLEDSIRKARGYPDHLIFPNDKCLGETMVVPGAAVLAQAIISYHRKNGVWLFEDMRAMTSDKDDTCEILLTCKDWEGRKSKDTGPGRLWALNANGLDTAHGLAVEVRPLQ